MLNKVNMNREHRLEEFRNFMEHHRKNYRKRHFISSIIFISIGSLLLLKNFNLLPSEIPDYVFSWKMLLIVFGVIFLFKRKWIPGIILIGIGKYLLIPEILGIPRPEVYQLWPVVLIIMGLGALLKAVFPKEKHTPIIVDKQTSDFMESIIIFGGDSKKISSYDFKGGKFTTVFGGLELDLTDCCLSKDGAVMEIVSVMGGVTMKVPKEWNIQSETLPVMGGIHDEIQDMPDAYVDPAAVLTLKGVAVLGGIDIRRI